MTRRAQGRSGLFSNQKRDFMHKQAKAIINDLNAKLGSLNFKPPVHYVYNPGQYARQPFEAYIDKFGSSPKQALFLGMNPGPFGMAQTGIPFGAVTWVRDWMGIEATVDQPKQTHPKRPVVGFGIGKDEVSGARFWGWAEQRFGTAEQFFERFFVLNYCPLLFLEASGRNRTPDKLPANERQAVINACNAALRAWIDLLQPQMLIGIGVFAEKQLKCATAKSAEIPVHRILHPSPASPMANRGWATQAEKQLLEIGLL